MKDHQIPWQEETPYIIAEIGANHNGDMDLARKLIDTAAQAGASAVKFQVKTAPDELATKQYAQDLNDGKVKLENVAAWRSEALGLSNIFEQAEKFHLTFDQYSELFDYARKQGIGVGASVFSDEGVNFLSEMQVDFVKVASMDIDNYTFLRSCFRSDLPVIVSTGMASLGEIGTLVDMIPIEKRSTVALLHCVSIYPPKDEHINLKVMDTLSEISGLTVGYSDHSIGTALPLAAIARGALILEKHFTLDVELPGWDHKVSVDPSGLATICEQAKRIVAALGDPVKHVSEQEHEKRQKFRRSVVTSRKISKGEVLSADSLNFKRPGTGIPASQFDLVLGRTAKHDLLADVTLGWSDIQ